MLQGSLETLLHVLLSPMESSNLLMYLLAGMYTIPEYGIFLLNVLLGSGTA